MMRGTVPVMLLALLMVVSCALPRLGAEEETAGPQLVFLLIGQSNMAGRAPLADEDQGPIAGTWLLNEQGRWEPATNPLNRYSTDRKTLSMQRLCPGDGFARRLHELVPDRKIGLIVNARGGSSIEQWAKGQPLYDNMLRRVQAWQAQSSGGQLAGVLWHQGEANASDPEYLDKLIRLVETLRRDLNSPDLPFIAGQVAGEKAVNALIAKLPEKVKNTACVKSEDLTVFDGVHFDRESQKKLGAGYADAYLGIIKIGPQNKGP